MRGDFGTQKEQKHLKKEKALMDMSRRNTRAVGMSFIPRKEKNMELKLLSVGFPAKSSGSDSADV